jgi:hypothetical protein
MAARGARRQQPELPELTLAVTFGAQDVTCARCNARFSCAANATSCWCQSLPPLELSQRPLDLVDGGCLCPGCLQAAVSTQRVR